MSDQPNVINQLINPLYVQTYERYIPTAFDEGMTLLEKMNKVIIHLNRIGKLTNDTLEQWNQVMDWVMSDGIDSAIDSKIDAMLQDGTLQTLIGNDIINKTKGKINVKEMGAMGDGSDATLAIQSALDLAKISPNGIEVYIPDGDYLINTHLIIYRNTALKLGRKARILRGSYVTMLINGDHSDTSDNPLSNIYDPYSGHGNIIIEGGIWDGNILNQPYANTGFNIFGLDRARNIVVRDVEFRDVVTCHALDLNALDDVLIDNCRFLGYKDATQPGDDWYPRNYVEAIQISNILEQVGNVPADGTPCKNIKIRNNYFGSSGTVGTQAWCQGVGAHTAVYGVYNENILVEGNTFDGMTYAGTKGFKFKNFKVVNNTFKNCNQGVTMSNSSGLDSTSNYYDTTSQTMVQKGLPQAGMDMLVSDNTFENTKANVLWVRGQTNGSNIAKFDKLVFSNNIIERNDGTYSTGNLLDVSWCSNVTIKDNGHIYKVYRGVMIQNCDHVLIENVSIEDTTFEGIYVTEFADSYQNQGYTNHIFMKNVRMNNIKYTGILVNYARIGKIENCYLEDTANTEDNTRNGIMIASSSDSFSVEGCTVKLGSGNQNQYGLMITSGATNCRGGINRLEGKTTPANVAGDTNWLGYYVYSPNGTRYKTTISDAGVLTVVAG